MTHADMADFDVLERELLERGLARVYRGRLIPVIRGAEGDPPADPAADPSAADPPAERSFTQADVDRIVQERLARAKSAPPADYDDLKAKAARLAEIEAENQTELEKAQTRAAELEKQASEATQRAREALLRSAVVAEAARKNVVDPDAAVALLDRSTLELDDDGSPKNIAEAMDSLLKAKPYLAGGARAGGSADLGARGGDAGKGQLTREQLKAMTPEQIVKARQEGRLDSVMRGEA